MANTSAALDYLLDLKASINMYTQQQIFWSNKNETNAKIVSKQEGYQGKFEDAMTKAIGNSSELTASHNGQSVTVQKENQSEPIAEQYAVIKVWQYDEELLEECSSLDVEYDTMQTMYETLLQKLRADEEAAKQVVSTDAQDTGLLGQ